MRFFSPNKKLCSPILATLCTAFMCLVASPDIVADEAKFDFFEKKIRPVLVEHCYECHSTDAGEVKAGLHLDHAEGILGGGDSGPAIDLSSPDESLIVKALRYDEDFYQMPPKAKLDDQVAADFQQWILQGAPDPRTVTTSPKTESQPADHNQQLRDSHWAFQLPQVAALDDQPPSNWIRNGLDRFVLAQLRHDRIEPSAAAEDDTLVRRLYLDLIGTPPTYEQIQQFRQSGTESYDALVDQLLNSPKFGERWARLWMDVARYSDTKGYVFTEDRAYADAYKYREWLIQAFNQDVPFDQFVFQQLSADRSDFADDPDELAAMGFLTLGRRFLNNKHDIIDDRIDVVTRGLLGLTVTCARCHDHKYDPIPMADYYSLYGVFDSSREPNDPPSRLRMVDDANPKDAPIFLRGNSSNPGEVVPRRFLLAVAGSERPAFQDGSGRKELAEAIASKDNPLTARVFVNRVFGRLTGTYLVDTPSDFGLRSEPPIHQMALDYLAVEFMNHGWSTKWLIKEIVTSATYRQVSNFSPEMYEMDPENRWMARMNRRRLDFEAMRDSLLWAANLLDDSETGGKSVDLADKRMTFRRSIYAYIDRQNFPSLYRTFDVASPDTHAPKRFDTTVPQQALFLLNSPFAKEICFAIGQRYANDTRSIDQRLEAMLKQIFSRAPTDQESAWLHEFVETAGANDAKAWSRLAQTLLLSNEFLFVD